MHVAKFNPAGGPITVGITCDPNQNGSYSITLWEAADNSIVRRFRGNFINTADDSYELDRPNDDHDGRLLEALAVVAIPSGMGPSDLTVTVSQGGVTLASDIATVPPGAPGQMVDLFVALEAR